MRLRRSGSAVAALLLFTAMRSVAQVDLSAWPQVRMELFASDGNGDALRGLTADALVLRESSKPVSVDELKPLTTPVSVCVLVDDSGSIYENLQSMKAAVTHFIESLPPEDDFCIADFSTVGFLDQALTTDRTLIAKALSYIRASGGTALYDSLVATSAYMRKEARQSSHEIVIFSDGGDNASKNSLNALRAHWRKPGFPAVHIIWVPPSRGTSSLVAKSRDKKIVVSLANMNGGLVYLPRNQAEMMSACDDLLTAIKNRYVLTYTTADASNDGRERQIDVGLDKAHLKAKDVVRAPEGFYAPLP